MAAVALMQQCCKNPHFLLTQGGNLNSLSTNRNSETRISRLRRLVGRTVLGAVIFAAAACATVDQRKPEEVVAERAKARWDLLLKNDIQAAYQFLSPASRATMSLERYTGTIKPGFWKAATVEKVKCESAEICSVEALIEYEFKGNRANTPLKEKWIREGSQWWYVQN